MSASVRVQDLTNNLKYRLTSHKRTETSFTNKPNISSPTHLSLRCHDIDMNVDPLGVLRAPLCTLR